MAKHETTYRFKEALRWALLRYEAKGIKKGTVLRQIARNLIDTALCNERQTALSAIKEIADRLDGKPVQSIAGPDGEPITVVKRIIVQEDRGNREIDVTPSVSTIEGESVENTNTKH